MFVLVTFVGWIVARYASTYLDGEDGKGDFTGWLCLTLAAVLLLVTAGNLVQLVVSWIATSLFLYKLLVFYGRRPGARRAARKRFITARLGDIARIVAAVLLVLPPDRLMPCERLQFPGHDDADGEGMVAAVRRAAGRADLPERHFPWALMQALAPFGEFPREVSEVRAFWAYPVRLDGRRLATLIGDHPQPPLDRAVAARVAAYAITGGSRELRDFRRRSSKGVAPAVPLKFPPIVGLAGVFGLTDVGWRFRLGGHVRSQPDGWAICTSKSHAQRMTLA